MERLCYNVTVINRACKRYKNVIFVNKIITENDKQKQLNTTKQNITQNIIF